jgi:hypothetical protein
MSVPMKPLITALLLCASATLHAAEQHATVADPDGFTNLRTEKGKVLDRVRVGDPFVLLEHDKARQRWHVRLPSGLGGYIHESRIRPITKEQAKASQAAKIAKLPRMVDTAIAGISWLDPDSAERVIGKNIKTVEEDGGFPTAWCLNATRTEQLELTLHYGALVNDFSEYSVRPVKGQGRGTVLAGVEHFTTAKGVRLGLSEKQVTAIFGKPTQVETKGGERILQYRVSRKAGETAGNLMRDWELYYGHYHFRAGKLVQFDFGFEYP